MVAGHAFLRRSPGLGPLLRQRDGLIADRDDLLAQRDEINSRYDNLHAGQMAAKADIDRLNAHVAQLTLDYHDTLEQRAALYKERDLVTGQREALQQRHDELVEEFHQVVRELQRLSPLVDDPRSYLADRFLRGEGIEIGALHRPTRLAPSAHVRFVDRLSAADLRAEYPELGDAALVDASVIDDGERLTQIGSGCLDFIIANHFLEHCEDPIGTLATFRDRLRPSGTMFLAVPDRRRTFDHRRSTTTLDHLIADHTLGPDGSRHAHYEEWAALVEDRTGTDVAARCEELLKSKYSIHFHTFTPQSLAALYAHCGLELVASFEHDDEVITVVRA